MIWCNVFKRLWKKRILVSTIVQTASKGSSSSRWLRRQHADLYVKKALQDSYRCRSAYKLIELDDKFHFLQPGRVVIDCGASPGSWTQVAVERVASTKPGYDVIPGFVIAVDLLDIKDIPGATVLSRSDFTNADTQREIKVLIPDCGADVIMSDMAPNATGNHTMNHGAILDLCESALGFGKTVLKPGGVFLCKLWDGYGTRDFIAQMQKDFKFVKECKPRASRKESAELYIFAENFRKEDNSR